jgi:hypothetical protein
VRDAASRPVAAGEQGQRKGNLQKGNL